MQLAVNRKQLVLPQSVAEQFSYPPQIVRKLFLKLLLQNHHHDRELSSFETLLSNFSFSLKINQHSSVSELFKSESRGGAGGKTLNVKKKQLS